jgi:hypothetical protein
VTRPASGAGWLAAVLAGGAGLLGACWSHPYEWEFCGGTEAEASAESLEEDLPCGAQRGDVLRLGIRAGAPVVIAVDVRGLLNVSDGAGPAVAGAFRAATEPEWSDSSWCHCRTPYDGADPGDPASYPDCPWFSFDYSEDTEISIELWAGDGCTGTVAYQAWPIDKYGGEPAEFTAEFVGDDAVLMGPGADGGDD